MMLPHKLPFVLCLLCVIVSLLILVLTSTQVLFFSPDLKSLIYDENTMEHPSTADRSKGNFQSRGRKMAHLTLPLSQATPVNRSGLYSFEKRNEQNQLLLVTLGRSGSSFTSNLISHDSSVFYMFEPLFSLQKLMYGNHRRNSTAKPNRTVLQLLESFLSCNFQHSNVSFLDNIQLRLSGPEMKRFYTCNRSKLNGLSHIQCFLDLIEDCTHKNIVFAKTIRLSMSLAEELMLRMPHLKLLYLIRDPRAVLRSQALVFRNFKWPQELDTQAKKHCNGIANDLTAIGRISVLFPGRVHLIRYETGAMNPMAYVRDIYKFVGLNFTEDTATHIQAMTQGKGSPKQLKHPYSLVKSNTTDAANHWRSKVHYVNVKRIDKVCAKIYSRFGYKEVMSREQLYSNQPLFEPIF